MKPKLRGRLHAATVPAALTAGVVLIRLARTPQAALACTVYAVTALLLFGTSAIYRRNTRWSRREAVLRRLDQADKFLIVAGTCTPLAVLLLPSAQQPVLLWIVWTGALVGIAFRGQRTPRPRCSVRFASG
ncbi:hemolysin III family protein [Streptomyces caniferus]|uniref:hemolysin III family protein n=1 Tax=Streptomyces caniferus TaxID=285557 RepID=UPI003F4D5844